jgi:hypothetical protein
MNLWSIGCCSFLGLALLVVAEWALGACVDADLRWGLRGMQLATAIASVGLILLGSRHVGDLGATETHSRRSSSHSHGKHHAKMLVSHCLSEPFFAQRRNDKHAKNPCSTTQQAERHPTPCRDLTLSGEEKRTIHFPAGCDAM